VVARITANRPRVLNARSRVMIENDLLTIPHREGLGTFGAEARAKGVKARLEARDQRFGDTGTRAGA